MKESAEYIKDITEIRSMMERSSKFMSLSGWSGAIVGIYALGGAFLANMIMQDRKDNVLYSMSGESIIPGILYDLIIVGIALLVLAIGTAIFFAFKKSRKINEQLWNPTARRLIINMAIPLFAGGIFILILISKGLYGLMLPMTLMFYGLTLINAGKYSYAEIKYLGLINIMLGLMAAYWIDYGLAFWAVGFGIMHIIYGLYIHLRYEK